MSSENWKEWVTQQRQEYSQRRRSALHIEENGSLSLGYPTPKASDSIESNSYADQQRNSPALLPYITITHLDQKSHKKNGKNPASSWSTPIVGDSLGGNLKLTPEGERISKKGVKYGVKLKDQVAHMHQITDQKMKLNPLWVEQLMGIPTGWTGLGSWATELCQTPQS